MGLEFYLNGGAPGKFGRLMDRFVSRMGFRGARFGLFNEAYFKENIQELAVWISRRPRTKHIYLIDHAENEEEILYWVELIKRCVADLGIGQNVLVEPQNEPDLKDAWKDPFAMGVAVRKVWEKLEGTGITVISPGVGIGADSLCYAVQMLSAVPKQVAFGFHRYVRHDLTNPLTRLIGSKLQEGPHCLRSRKGYARDLILPHEGYASRLAEVERILEVADGRKIYCTETGQTETHSRPKQFPWSWWNENYWLSPDEVARQIEDDARFWAAVDILEGVVYYQLNDGPDRNESEDRFGWRHCDGNGVAEPWDGPWKVVAQVMPSVIKELDYAG